MPEVFKHKCICSLKDKSIQRNLSLGIIIDHNPQSWTTYADELHPEEQSQLERRITNGAKNSFYLARIAAKMALEKLPNEKNNESWIDHGIFGFPVLESNNNGLKITLAHTESSGFAACFDQRDKIGVDIEEIENTKNAIIETSLTTDEIELVGSYHLERSKYLHLIWAAREALSKALQTGFLIPLELLAVASIEKKNDLYEVKFKHFSLFEVIAFQLHNSICTIAFPERCELDLEPILELKERYERDHYALG
ncbi:MAG: 4'-phosphopantetheinyl transferase superfamily protein [Flavobacteriaceae bacterium]|nr:4'-phosphopantetheinyl transferase superfamily protein [Flavobacteriaceae bacterium]